MELKFDMATKLGPKIMEVIGPILGDGVEDFTTAIKNRREKKHLEALRNNRDEILKLQEEIRRQRSLPEKDQDQDLLDKLYILKNELRG